LNALRRGDIVLVTLDLVIESRTRAVRRLTAIRCSRRSAARQRLRACVFVSAFLALPAGSLARGNPDQLARGNPDQWVLSFKGVEGVTVMSAPEKVRSTWRVPLPVVYITRGSSTEGVGLVCHGRQRGTAYIFGDSMLAVWFRSGIRTDTGIYIGSLRSQLRATYGNRLERDIRDYDNLYTVKADASPPRPALSFVVRDGRVRAIGYGLAAELSRSESFSVDCQASR
jgi:hypothetical protein